MDELLEQMRARLYVMGVAFDMLQAAWEGLTLDADVVEQRALRLRDLAMAGV